MFKVLLKQPFRQLGVIQPTAGTAIIHQAQFAERKPTANLFQVVASWEGGWQIQVTWHKSKDDAVPQSSVGRLLSAGI